ncbi:formylglycine-generating enzyme family protein, partial [Limnofasciculus baicalensis]
PTNPPSAKNPPTPTPTNPPSIKNPPYQPPNHPIIRFYSFDIATIIEKRHTGFFGNKTTWEITCRRSRAEDFIEDLGSGVILEMVSIPGGTFLMGSPNTEENRSDSEGPQHYVTVPPFYMGKFTVTQAQWKAVAALPQVNQTLNPDPSRFKGNNLPVESVSWLDVVEFCARLSKKTGRDYRLPSEAEWEYACRAGTNTPFHFGETITPDLVNYNGNYPYRSAPKGEYRVKTTPVGSFQVANAFGLFDMHGNVWEWCSDSWHENYSGSPVDGSSWSENDNQKRQRLWRGGSWGDIGRDCRSAYRDWNEPGGRYSVIGFRLVVS